MCDKYTLADDNRRSQEWITGKGREYNCKHCNKDYYTKRRGGEGQTFCSRGCAYAYKADRKQLRRDNKLIVYRTFRKQCAQCGDMFWSSSARKVRCSRKCELVRSREASVAYEVMAHKLKPAVECAHCSILFTRLYGNKSRACSSDCSLELKRIDRRKYRSSRRARVKGNGTPESFDPFYVFGRDKWMCVCCGRKTPISHRGSTKDSAPELDHIIPLSLGGEHSRVNTQCLCRACNQAKSNGARSDQLLMFG